MRLGIVLPVEGEKACREVILRATLDAEALGFHSVWVTDRILKPSTQPSGYPYSEVRGATAFNPDRNWLDPIAVMGMAVAVTDRIAIGTNVLVLPYRQPIVLAQEVASLDWLSGGRIVLGVGSGWMIEEFDALGVPRTHRGARTDEYIDVLRTLWSGGSATFSGESVSFVDMTLAARTSMPGGPPIFVGGNTEAALKRAALRGDGWLGFDLEPSETRIKVDQLMALGAAQGRDMSGFTVSMRKRLEPQGGLGFVGAAASPQDSAERLAGEIVEYRSSGVNLLVIDLLMLPDMFEAMEWLMKDVLPITG